MLQRDFGAIGPSFALYSDCLNLRGQSRSFESLVSYDIVGGVGLDRRGNPSVVWPYMVSGSYFDSMDAQPYLGRFIHSSDERGRIPCAGIKGVPSSADPSTSLGTI